MNHTAIKKLADDRHVLHAHLHQPVNGETCILILRPDQAPAAFAAIQRWYDNHMISRKEYLRDHECLQRYHMLDAIAMKIHGPAEYDPRSMEYATALTRRKVAEAIGLV